ncbi:MAG: hypothetical protein CSA68_11655 [Rhodobacterales bacterium]|nr:MAG: hypothetical protein CSA68_11655 [Rhodobacterales bacterium]
MLCPMLFWGQRTDPILQKQPQIIHATIQRVAEAGQCGPGHVDAQNPETPVSAAKNRVARRSQGTSTHATTMSTARTEII